MKEQFCLPVYLPHLGEVMAETGHVGVGSYSYGGVERRPPALRVFSPDPYGPVIEVGHVYALPGGEVDARPYSVHESRISSDAWREIVALPRVREWASAAESGAQHEDIAPPEDGRVEFEVCPPSDGDFAIYSWGPWASGAAEDAALDAAMIGEGFGDVECIASEWDGENSRYYYRRVSPAGAERS